jgi:hypothetical protein
LLGVYSAAEGRQVGVEALTPLLLLPAHCTNNTGRLWNKQAHLPDDDDGSSSTTISQVGSAAALTQLEDGSATQQQANGSSSRGGHHGH